MPFDFLLTVIASTAGTTFLLGAAAFLGRSQISHWLAKDLEKKRNEYAKDLEDHKLSLIAQAEHAKSAVAIRQAGALLCLEMQYRSFVELLNCLNILRTNVASISMRGTKTKEQADEAMQAVNSFLRAINGAVPFISSDEHAAFLDCWRTMCNQVLPHCRVGSPAIDFDFNDAPDRCLDDSRDITVGLLRRMSTG